MKKILAYILTCVMIFGSVLPVSVFGAGDDEKNVIFAADFSSYTTTGRPSGWISYSGGAVCDNYLTPNGGKFKITAGKNESHGAMVDFGNAVIERGKSFFVEFDVSRNNSGFYLALLGESDLTSTADTGEFVVAKALVGSGVLSTDAVRIPQLGYADNSGALTSFGSGADAKLNTSKDATDHIKLEISPISTTKTKFEYTLNSNSPISVETNKDLMSADIHGIGFSTSVYLKNADAYYVELDNLNVYTYISAPKVSQIAFYADNTELSGGITDKVDEIKVNFDVDTVFNNLTTDVQLLDESGTPHGITPVFDAETKTLSVSLNTPLTPGEAYNFKIANGYNKDYSTKVMEPYTKAITPTADAFSVKEIRAYVGEEKVSEITDAVSKYEVEFSHKIVAADVEKVKIKKEDGSSVEGVEYSLATDDKTVEIDVAGHLEATKKYTITIDDVRYKCFESVTTSVSEPISVTKAAVNVVSVKFYTSDGTEHTDMANIPYNLYKITTVFDKGVASTGIGSYIGIDGLTSGISYDVSVDKKTVDMILDGATITKGDTLTFKISGSLAYAGNSAVTVGEDVKYEFTVSSSSEYVYTYYLNQDFEGFSNDDFKNINGMGKSDQDPEFYARPWYTLQYYTYEGYVKKGDGYESTQSLNLFQPYITIGQFEGDRKIPAGAAFVMEFDLKYNFSGSILRFGVTGEQCMTNHDNNTLPDFKYWSSENGNLRIVDGTVNYATETWTNSKWAQLTDLSLNEGDVGYALEIPNDNNWHHLKVEYFPKSNSATTLKVSLDGGKVYTAETKLDFYTWLPESVYFGKVWGQDANGADIKVDTLIDNVNVYLKSEIMAPELIGVTIKDYFGNTTNPENGVTSAAEEISLQFNTTVFNENLGDFIKLKDGNTDVPVTFSVDETGMLVSMKPSVLLDKQKSYRLVVAPGIKYSGDRRFTSTEGSESYFITNDETFFDITSNTVVVESGGTSFDFELINTVGEDKDLVAVIAEYEDVTIGTKTYKRLTDIKTMKFTAVSGVKTTKNLSAAEITGSGDSISAYVISADKGNVLFESAE